MLRLPGEYFGRFKVTKFIFQPQLMASNYNTKMRLSSPEFDSILTLKTKSFRHSAVVWLRTNQAHTFVARTSVHDECWRTRFKPTSSCLKNRSFCLEAAPGPYKWVSVLIWAGWPLTASTKQAWAGLPMPSYVQWPGL